MEAPEIDGIGQSVRRTQELPVCYRGINDSAEKVFSEK